MLKVWAAVQIKCIARCFGPVVQMWCIDKEAAKQEEWMVQVKLASKHYNTHPLLSLLCKRTLGDFLQATRNHETPLSGFTTATLFYFTRNTRDYFEVLFWSWATRGVRMSACWSSGWQADARAVSSCSHLPTTASPGNICPSCPFSPEPTWAAVLPRGQSWNQGAATETLVQGEQERKEMYLYVCKDRGVMSCPCRNRDKH